METNETLSDELKRFLEGGKKPIVITFSSMLLSEPESFMCKLVQALKAADERAVILTGNSGITGNSGKDCFFTESCPHLSLFQYAKGVVHHGGAGTMAAALKSGIPQQIIPFSVDQPFWADRLYKLGYGLKPLKEKNLSTDDLVNSFKMMNDSVLQMKVKQIGEKINAEKGNERIVEYLERLIFSRIYPKES